jgi:predicted N-acetyltransferase YhbS
LIIKNQRRVLFEKVQHNGDCRLTGRFEDSQTNLPLKGDCSQQFSGGKTMNTNDYTIRLERPEDHREVENLVRESFWNVYRPGCSEHYVIHVLRNDPAFVKELDFVMEQDGKLIGQNMFMKTVINADDGKTVPVLTMGPICITPELKRKGYGKALLDYSLEKAAETVLGLYCLKETSLFTARADLTMPVSLVFVTTTCRRMRMIRSFSAKN